MENIIKPVFRFSKTIIFIICIMILFSFCYAKEETNMEMKKSAAETSIKPKGKISVVIDNSYSVFSPKKYYLMLQLEKNTLTQIASKDEIEGYEIDYKKDLLEKRKTKLTKISNIKELDQLIHQQYPREWYPRKLSQDDLMDYVKTNEDYSSIIYYQIGKAALIDLKTKTIVNFFRNAQRFVWDKTGTLFAYDATAYPLDLKKISNLEFVVYDVHQRKEILRRQIPKAPDEIEMISNFAWSPDSHYVAVVTLKVVDVSWTRILGHGTATLKYNLSIYNLSGELLYTKPIDGTYKGDFFVRMEWSDLRQEKIFPPPAE